MKKHSGIKILLSKFQNYKKKKNIVSWNSEPKEVTSQSLVLKLGESHGAELACAHLCWD